MVTKKRFRLALFRLALIVVFFSVLFSILFYAYIVDLTTSFKKGQQWCEDNGYQNLTDSIRIGERVLLECDNEVISFALTYGDRCIESNKWDQCLRKQRVLVRCITGYTKDACYRR